MPRTLFNKIGVKLSDLWGRGPDSDKERESHRNAKPPELDKLWARFNERLSRLFSRKGGRSSPDPSMQGAGIAGVILALVCVVVWLVSGTFIVQEGHAGIILTFGKYTDTRPPGLGWRWPAPIQSIEMVNVSKAREVQIGFRATDKNKQPKEALMLTSDKNIIDMQFAIQYSLKDPAKWVFNYGDQEDTIRQVAESAIREVVGKTRMDALLYEDRTRVANAVKALMQTICDSNDSGVQITKVAVQNAGAPEQVQAAFDDIEKARRDSERLKSEAQAYANDVLPKAKGEASRQLQEADAYRARVVTNANGEAERFKAVLAEYQKAPAITRDRLYIETMQHIMTRTTKVLVDSKGGSPVLLPLDKLMTQTATGEAAKAADAAKPASQAVEQAPAAAAPSTTSAPTAPAAVPAASAAASKPVPSSRARESRDREAR